MTSRSVTSPDSDLQLFGDSKLFVSSHHPLLPQRHRPGEKPLNPHRRRDRLAGYGIDYAERYRNLPYIAALKPSVYE